MIRESIANWFISTGISVGRAMGLKMGVELSEHSIDVRMQQADKSKRAWDDSLYVNGNVFLDGKANPIKPRVVHNEGIQNPDTVEIDEGDVDPADVDVSGDNDNTHTEVMSSPRYKLYMLQDLFEQVLTPEQRWNKMLYGLMAIAVLQFVGIIVTLYATGSFA